MAKKATGGSKKRGKRGGAPVDVGAVMEAMGDLDQMRNLPVDVCLVIDVTASDELIDAVLEAFEAQSAQAEVHTVLMTGSAPQIPMPCDLCVVVGGESLLLGDAAASARRAGCPTAVVIQSGETYFAESQEDAEEIVASQSAPADAAPAIGAPIPLDTVVEVDFSLERPFDELGLWIMCNAPAKRVSLAEYFAFIRWPFSLELTRLIALQNAAVGLVFIVPGADMPVITLNQIKLVLQIASVYGQPLDMTRALEIAAVVGGAFGFRALARELSGAVPVLGWGIKGGIAYTGTLAIGQAALEYFDEGGRINGLARVITQAVEEATAAYAE